MTNVKLEDLPNLVLAVNTLFYGENAPFAALADAGKIPLSLLDARYAALYLALVGGTMAGAIEMDGNYVNDVGRIAFNLANSATAGVGQVQWNNTEGTVEIGLLGGIVVLQLGQESHVRAIQRTGSTIDNGKSVTIIGSTGTVTEIGLTDIAFGTPRDSTIGLTTESIDHNQAGYITTFGLVRGVDTNAWSEGAFLFADATTPGDLTNVPSTAPGRAVFIGIVVKKGGVGSGSIYVTPHNQPNLSALSDVYAPVLNDGDYLRWSAANSRWEASAT